MNRIQVLLLVGAIAACGACTGCGGAYRAETVLHADGSIDRAVYQTVANTPEAAQDAKLWKQVTFAPKPDDMDKKGWPDALTMLPAHAKDEQHSYFAAWNHFASVKDVPDAVVFGKAPENSGLPDGKLVRELTKTDLGFVEQYDWRETLTDVVSLPDMRKAREELEDLMIRFGQDVFPEAVGKEYDPADLVQWCKTDGKDWLNELTDLVFETAAAHKGPERDRAVEAAVRASCERHGLKLPKDPPLLGPNAQKAAQDFALSLVGEKVKKDGKPVGRDEAQKWLDELNSKDGGRFAPAARKIVAQKYDGDKAFSGRVGALAVRIVGLYLVGPPWDFHYAMTFPGPVIETNGEMLGDGDKVLWRFKASDAYPLGYAMKARSLLVPEDARKLIARAKPLSDRDALATYADLVRDDEALAKAARQCRADMSLDPLNEYVAGQKNTTAGNRAEKVLKLLKAP